MDLSEEEEHLVETNESLSKYSDKSRVPPVQFDLEALRNVPSVTSHLTQTLTRIHALILNADISVGPFSLPRQIRHPHAS